MRLWPYAETIKNKTTQIEDEDYSQGIMPVLKEGSPELYERIEKDAPVDDQVSMDHTPDYTVDIPVDFLPE